MGLISRVSSRTYSFFRFTTQKKMFRSALRMSLAKAPLANGPLQAPTNLNQLHARNFARVQSKSWIGAMTVGLVWLWMVRISNSELCFDYVKHIDLNERRDAMRAWGVFPAHPADWQRLTSQNSPTRMTNKSKTAYIFFPGSFSSFFKKLTKASLFIKCFLINKCKYVLSKFLNNEITAFENHAKKPHNIY